MKILRKVPYGSVFILIVLSAGFSDGAFGQESKAQNSEANYSNGQAQGTADLKTEQDARSCASLGNYCSIEKCRNNRILANSCTAFGTRDNSPAMHSDNNREDKLVNVADFGADINLLGAPLVSDIPTAGSPPPSPSPSPKASPAADAGLYEKSPADPGEDNPSADNARANDSNPQNSNGGGPSQQSRAQCQAAAQRAASACGSQGGGGYGSYSGGINTYGNALGNASGSASNANLQAAINCTSQWRNCASQCQGVEPYLAGQCQAYANVVSEMGLQAEQAYQAQQGAYNSGAQSTASRLPFQQTKQIENCDFNPSSAECQALDAASKRAEGKSGFEENLKSDPKFNINGNDGARTQYNAAFTGNPEDLDNMKPGPKNGTVPNNSGGQIPGGSAQSQAQLAANRGASPGSPGYSTDVMQGFQGGGGTTASGGSAARNVNSNSGRWNYSETRNPAMNGVGLDLKRYLPGGESQKARHLGGYIPFSVEINGPNVNIWSRISDRLMEKCRLGELMDCR